MIKIELRFLAVADLISVDVDIDVWGLAHYLES
jgi:hypothetical protein